MSQKDAGRFSLVPAEDCDPTRSAEVIRRLHMRIARLLQFAWAHEAWEGMVLNDDGHWFDDMPEDILAAFEELQKHRVEAMKEG